MSNSASAARDLCVASLEAATTLIVAVDPKESKAMKRISLGRARALIRAAVADIDVAIKEMRP